LKEDGQDDEPVQQADPDLEALEEELDNAKESGCSLLCKKTPHVGAAIWSKKKLL
jgi:hypothetical protein